MNNIAILACLIMPGLQLVNGQNAWAIVSLLVILAALIVERKIGNAG